MSTMLSIVWRLAAVASVLAAFAGVVGSVVAVGLGEVTLLASALACLVLGVLGYAASRILRSLA